MSPYLYGVPSIFVVLQHVRMLIVSPHIGVGNPAAHCLSVNEDETW